jgi:hypothetical protein
MDCVSTRLNRYAKLRHNYYSRLIRFRRQQGSAKPSVMHVYRTKEEAKKFYSVARLPSICMHRASIFSKE